MRHLQHWLLGMSLVVLAPAGLAVAGDKKTPAMQPLWADQKDKDAPAIYVHLADKPNGAAVVICPGGGYGDVMMSYEGHDVARWLNTLGVAGIVLKYRHAPKYRHPVPLEDAQRALRTVRARAKAWKLDPDRVGILGFSAGGHLASTAGTHFDLGMKDAKDPIDAESCRPNFMILAYPVITLTGPAAHKGSLRNLLGDNPDPKLIDELSNEKQVTDKTPPTFLVHTRDDAVVPPQNSVLFFDALDKHKVPAEIHIYEKGPHGLGIDRRPDLPFSSWPALCAAWLDGRGMLKKSAK
jgi:acetyl esterase/lipase